ncbi:MAG: antitoxin Xre/MbcA/ParS toxin-binding domain-containing protein [Desulfobacterales bacterium]
MYGQSIGIQTENVNGLILLLKQGLPVSTFSRLSTILGVPEKSLATTVNIPQRTLTRRKKEGRLKTDESERVLRLACLYERAIEVYGDEDLARQWFRLPVKGLGGKTPLEFADTEPGAREVEDMLGRIEDGVVY